MFISKIQSFGITNIFKKDNRNYDYTPRFNLVMSKPICADTVSFTATPKFNSKKAGVSLDTARKIHAMVSPYQNDIMRTIEELFDDLVATEYHPEYSVHKIIPRVKSALSIKEKSSTRQWNNTQEILQFMTDLNGVKIEMRNADKKNVDELLNRLIPAIKSREIEVLEIENKRPMVVKGLPESKASKYDYGSTDLLEKIIRIQEEVWNGKNCIGKEKLVSQNLYGDFTDANYCAIHLLLSTRGKNARVFELQIMGKDVSESKKVDDLVWKILNGKDVEPKYRSIAKIIKPFADTAAKAYEMKKQMLEENPSLNPETITLKTIFQKVKDVEFKQALKELISFNEYRGDVFLFQRKREPSTFSKKPMKTRFLPLTSDIDPRLDFNYLYDEIERCDAMAKKLEKASKSKKSKK